MTAKEQGLPELPEAFSCVYTGGMVQTRHPVYNAAQMHKFRAEGIAAALAALASDTGESGVVLTDAATSDAVSILCELTGEHRIGMDDGRMDYLCSIANRIAALRAQPDGVSK